MRNIGIIAAVLGCLALLAWLTGAITLGYHCLALCVAFLADYLTPQRYTALSIDHAWQQWWHPGVAARWVLYQRDPALQRATQAYALLGGLGIGMALLWLIPWQHMRLKVSAVHGTAHWATLREVRPFLALWGRRARQESQLPLGLYKGRRLTLKEKHLEEHVLVVGPTGKGKTAGIIIPGLLSECGNRSLLVIDPKQELVALTAGAIARRMRVWLFAPTEPEKSQRYNPLAHIHTMEDAEEFAACWVANTGRSSDPFWDRNTELLITAAVLHLRVAEPQAPFARLADLLSATSFEELEEILSQSPSEQARKTATAFLKSLKLNEKTAGGVLTDIGGRFFRMQNPRLRAVTAYNDIDFEAMIDRPTALYLSVPASAAERLQPLTACFLMQMFAAFVRRAEREPRGRLPRGVTCYLDEFANAGKIPHMAQRITMLRSTRVGLILAIQNYSQLDALYGSADRKTMLANATTHIVLPGAGEEETTAYSNRIGQTTVIGQSMNRNARSSAESWSQGQQETGRKLIMPEELRTMKRGHLLLLSDTLAPLIVKNIPYYRDRALARLAGLPFTPRPAPVDQMDQAESREQSQPEEKRKEAPVYREAPGTYEESPSGYREAMEEQTTLPASPPETTEHAETRRHFTFQE